MKFFKGKTENTLKEIMTPQLRSARKHFKKSRNKR